jgi:hypothetical protein
MNPHVKSLLQYEKWMLEHKIAERGLVAGGTKRELAERIAEFESMDSVRRWSAISTPRPNTQV